MSNNQHCIEVNDFLTFFRSPWHCRCWMWEKSESPDFLLFTEDGIIGLEHTKLFIQRHNGSQRDEGDTNRIVDNAHRLFLNKSSMNLMVQIVFLEPFRERRLNHERLTVDLSDFILGVIESLEPMKSHSYYDDIPEDIAGIHIVSVPEAKFARWEIARAGFVLMNATGVIQETIQAKEKKQFVYKNKCDHTWLLMVCGHDPSGYIHPDQASVDHVYSSDFDKVFVLDRLELKVHPLTVIPRGHA